MEIDLYGDPPTARQVETARTELENSRLLIVQNEAHVAELYKKLLVKVVVIAAILVIVAVLYFILPAGMFGMVNGRTVMLVTVSIMLMTSLLWIGLRTWKEARSILPSRGYAKEQLLRLQKWEDDLADIDIKLRLNIVNLSRMDGVLAEYVKKASLEHRHLIGLEYAAIRDHIQNKGHVPVHHR